MPNPFVICRYAPASRQRRWRGIRLDLRRRDFPKSSPSPARCFRIITRMCRCMAISQHSRNMTMEQLTFWSEEPLASLSVSQDFAKDLLTTGATSHSDLFALLKAQSHDGWFGKMSPVCCPLTEDGHLAPSSARWRNAGMGSPTAFLTLSISECHSDAGVCSLSDILETGDLPQRYYLSAKACSGILRRAEKRGKKLPEHLKAALLAVAGERMLTSPAADTCDQSQEHLVPEPA